jgi:hypothetical protein
MKSQVKNMLPSREAFRRLSVMFVGTSSQPWKEVPTVVNFTRIDAVAGMGAAYTGVRSPWANLVGTGASLAVAGASHARMQHLILSVGNSDARRVEFPPAVAAMTQLVMTAPLPTAEETRKQTSVQKTRINAGGYGAMGPHPEREPA